ncbi:MAG: hypothetical protein Q7J29_04340 [Stagnimonas sp.]|nr:hypothetical protein [Stagnimonas sp.]
MRHCLWFCGLLSTLLPGAVHAHSFGRLYNLPVPFWMYIYGAAAALLLSFLLVAWFATASAQAPESAPRSAFTLRAPRLLMALKWLAVFGLLLTMATGFLGNRDPYRNFSMTFFWVVFVLAFAYLTALIGDLYAEINPWATIAQWLDRAIPGFTQGRFRYPGWLGYWPALAFYMAFIWIELFGHSRPLSLATLLAAYSLLSMAGVWLVGAVAWFRYCEFFAVFLRLLARMAPVEYGQRGLRLRMPFTGLLEQPVERWSLLVFVLFMLSSTAFDGLAATKVWIQLFWGDPLGILEPWIGTKPIFEFPALRPVYFAWQTFCLLLSPFLYLGVYLMATALMKCITQSPLPLRELALRFALSLLPIVLVYNITHYYTLILTQGVKIVSLLSDPFGWRWNLFGTAELFRAPFLPGMNLVWHTQVGLILFGHIVSVYLAHMEALRIFPTRRLAAISQIPMLLLMVLFTSVGLWILAQPITS